MEKKSFELPGVMQGTARLQPTLSSAILCWKEKIDPFREDGGFGKHSLPPCTTTSKLQLNDRTTVIQNHQKLSWMKVLQLWS